MKNNKLKVVNGLTTFRYWPLLVKCSLGNNVLVNLPEDIAIITNIYNMLKELGQ
mgnify:CR=1 FL=1